MKKFLFIGITAAIVSAAAQGAGAQELSASAFYYKMLSVADEYAVEYQSDVTFKIGDNRMLIDEKSIYIDTAPVIIDSITYLPLRAVAEGFGAKVTYDDADREITVKDGSALAKLHVESDAMEMYFENGAAQDYTAKLSAVPVIDGNDRCLIPVRNIAEDILGCEVEWEGEEKKVTVSRKYQTKRLIVKTYARDCSFDELPLEECFCNNQNVYILQFALDLPDVVVRNYCMDLMDRSDIEYAEPDVIVEMYL